MKKAFLLLFVSFLVQSATAQWVSKGVGGGGAVFSVSINPYNSNEVYLSCDMSDMFHSTDFGASWSTIPFQDLVGFRNTAVRFTSDPQVRYTLRNTNGGYAPRKSTDGGASWISIANPAQASSANKCFQLFAHPQRSDLVIVSDKFNLYLSHDGGTSFGSAFYTDNTSKGLHLAGVFFNNNMIYVCVNKRFLVSSDTGYSFTQGTLSGIDTTQEEIVWFTGATQGTTTKLFCSTLNPVAITPTVYGSDVVSFKGLYRMNYGSASWTKINNNLPKPSVDQAFHIAMLQSDTATVYLSGATTVNINGSHPVHTVFKSTDGGNSFTNAFLDSAVIQNNGNTATGWVGWGGSFHNWYSVSFPGGISVDPNNKNNVFLSDGSSIHVTTNGGVSWRQAYVEQADEHPAGTLINDADEYTTNGLETTVCYWANWLDSLNIMVSFADLTAIRSTDGGNKWSMNYTGLTATKINDISIMIEHPANHYLYAATGDVTGSNGDFKDSRLKLVPGRIAYSTDGGYAWQVLYNFQKPALWIALDPYNSLRMYATIHDTLGGIGGVYVCNDIIDSSQIWHKLASPPRTEGRASSIYLLKDGTMVCAYSARDSGNYHYTASSGVFYSSDQGASWQDRTDAGMLYDVRGMAIDPNDTTQQTWFAFVGTNGSIQQGVYRTTNRGANWIKVFSTSAVTCTFHPYIPNEMYLCTETSGLYYVTNTNSFTPTFTPDNTFPFRAPQRIFFNPYNVNEVWAMTMGNGVRVGTSAHLTYSISATANTGGTISPPGTTYIGSGFQKTFSIIPDPFYHIDSLFVDGNYAGDSSTYTFMNVQSNHSIYVSFALDGYQIIATASGNGTVSPETSYVNYGNSQTIFFIPSFGYHVDSVLVDGLNTDSLSQYTFVNVMANHSVDVYFGQDTIPVISLDIPLNAGWNMLSVPLIVPDYSRVALFPVDGSIAFSYQGGYYQEDTLSNGRGYWMKFDTLSVVQFSGYERVQDSLDVAMGWNMIGGLSAPVAIASIGSNPPGLVTSQFFTFNGAGYVASDTLQPGNAYWVKATQGGKLYLSAGALSMFEKIHIIVLNEFPPAPPGDVQLHHAVEIPHRFALDQNFPNPFNPVTVIGYSLPVDSRVTLKVYTVLGEEVATLFDGMQDAGYKTQVWDAINIPSGIYFYRLTAGDFMEIRRLVLIK